MVGASRQESLPENSGTVEEASRSEANGSSTETYASTKNGTPAKEVESVDDGETSESEESIGNVSPLEESVRLPNSRRGRRTGERAERLRQSRADNRERRAAVEPILAKVILLRTTSDAARKPREAAESFFASLAQETGEDSAALIVGLRETVGIRRSTQRNVCKFVVSQLSWCKTATRGINQNCLRRRSFIACSAVDESNSMFPRRHARHVTARTTF